ncbi:NlpC/P60 family protein [Dactylosporangium sp. CA-139114]|uniref:C40 family peptidase n=1 Tax=Dactylosporangium sp. CA-139114 TaxID=3239931 RepID=UPI003D993D15
MSLAVMAPATVAHADPTLAEIEAQLDKQNDELEHTIEAWNKINSDLATSQTSAKALEDGVANANAGVEQIAIAAFKTNGSLRNLNLVLNATSSGSLMDQLSMLQQITRQQQKEIDDYKAAKAKLDETIAGQNAQKADLENKRKQIEGDVKKLQDLQRKAANAGAKKVAYNSVKAPQVDDATRQKVINFAYAQQGEPYHWGSAGPDQWDCSGLTMMAWKQVGANLPHVAADQWKVVQHISASEARPGDLVFMNNLGHVGIYVSPGRMIHAPHTGDVVREANISGSVYGYGRVKI